MRSNTIYLFVIVVICSCLPTFVFSQENVNPSCNTCHNGHADRRLPGPPYQLIAKSVHQDLDCTDCHESIDEDDIDPAVARPHGEEPESVNCGECHEDEAEIYTKHGRLEVGKDPDLPSCASCHGTHEILHSSDRQSHVHPINLPSTCRSCHTNVNLLKKHKILRDKPIKLFESSVHGKAADKGLYSAATCNDCHSATQPDGTRTAHRILSPSDPKSTTYHFNIPDTCGQCHTSITEEFLDGVHGKFVKQGSMDAPVCTHCHGEHGILPTSDLRSPVSAARLAISTCSPCHESEILNERLGISPDKLKTYIDSYHGLKRKSGDVHVANCASCHGVHRILASTDPASPIYPDNLQNTCGECHPGISKDMASAGIHSPNGDENSGWPYFFTVLYLWLIGLTVGFMLLHNVLHWLRYMRLRSRGPQVVRFNHSEVMQHWVLMLSFIVLAISGFSLRYSESWWVQLLFGWSGGEGFVLRGVIHRFAGIVMMLWVVWHALYLFTKSGRSWLWDMFPRKHDVLHIKQNVQFFAGQREAAPKFKRFGYVEKTEYWALMWGTVIMILTGVMLWFDSEIIERLSVSKVLIDVAGVVHYYEAWLATLAILIWHIYATVFSPTVYPMNPTWLRGNMPKDMHDHEHESD